MADLTGVSLGSYRILEQIGHGGMSMVYKAYHASTDRLVALKILPELLAQDPLLVERFQQEARVVARLEHRHIVPIYDFGECAGIVYLAMRYLQAGTVKDILARGRLSLPDALPMVLEVASALDYAHEQGIVHRDVKPGNILVDKNGDAYLTDFGLAKLLEASGELTHSGSLVGTPAYMAPEQTLGQPVSPATDVYALGVMIYEIATGRLPYVSDTPMALALMHLQATLPMPRTVNPALSEAVELVILKALDKDPSKRFPTAGELTGALAAAVEEETPPASAQLVQVASEIAGQKAPEEVTSGLRMEIYRQAAAEHRRRLLRWVPWGGAGLVTAGLALALLLTVSQTAQARVSAGQTATAVMVLVDQLEQAQTAVAAGGVGDLPTVEHLQTQVAAALTAGATLARTAPTSGTATQSQTATATAIATASPTPTSTAIQSPTRLRETPTLPLPTSTPLLPAVTSTPTSPGVTQIAPADTATDTLEPPTDTVVPSDTPTVAVETDTPTETAPPSSDTPTLSEPQHTPTDTPPPLGDTPTSPSDPPTDTPPPPTDTTTAPGF